MAASGAEAPKPLVEVAGRTLLEHNLRALAGAGVERVHLARGATQNDIGRIGADVAGALGIGLTEVVEHEPLGSVGALAMLPHDAEPVLVVNADNLTALDLAAVVEHHLRVGAAMTQAVHVEPFHMPFGEITVGPDGMVRAYTEKPTYEILVSSAVTVVSRAAIGLVRRGENINLPVLANRVLDAGLPLAAHRHEAAWVDVNDLSARERAEALLVERAEEFRRRGIESGAR
jgi:mannose-1-phosphate guanylyltransferase/phosphomannomutase